MEMINDHFQNFKRAHRPKATCRDCRECCVCPCDRHGFCIADYEWVDPDEVFALAEHCECFRPRSGYDPDSYETDDPVWDEIREEGTKR